MHKVPWTRLRFRFRRAALAAAALFGAQCASAACDRVYSVGFSESGTFAYFENQQLKGLIPVVLDELRRRTGCIFELKHMPRARLWLEWKAGSLDIVSGAVQNPERDMDGIWTGFTYAQEVLITTIAPPDGTVEGWLNLPQRPTVGRLRSAISGSSVDKLLEDPRYSRQVDEASDQIGVIRKLVAKRTAGMILGRSAFDKLAREFGIDPSTFASYPVRELPRVPYGLYFRTPQISATDVQRMVTVLEAMEKSGFDETAYAAIVGKAVAAQLYQGK